MKILTLAKAGRMNGCLIEGMDVLADVRRSWNEYSNPDCEEGCRSLCQKLKQSASTEKELEEIELK